MKSFTCPNGHTVANVDHETPCCDHCDLVATWYNRSTGEVHTWTDADEYHESCRSLRDQMDAAFDKAITHLTHHDSSHFGNSV